MTERVRKGGLQVAPIWADFISSQALPGTGVNEAKFWAGLDSLIHDLGAPQSRADRQARRNAGQDQRVARRPQRQAARCRGLQSHADGDRLPRPGRAGLQGRDAECRRRDRPHCRTAAGGARHERALRLERGQCALGFALRRALRNGCDFRRGRRDQGRRLQSRARRQGDRARPRTSRPSGAADIGIARRCGQVCDRGRFAGRVAARRRQGDVEERQAAGRLCGQRLGAVGYPARAQRHALGNRHRQNASDRRDRRGRRQGPRARVGRHHDHGSGRFDRRRRRRRQGRCLFEMARLDEGRSHRHLRQGRQADDAAAQPGSRLYGTRWQGAGELARPQPDADPQRRAPHDGQLRSRQGRPRGTRRYPRWRRHVADRHARPQQEERHPQFAQRLGLHRQAEDARAGGSRLRRYAVCPHRRPARPRPQYPQDGHHGRRAAHDRQSQGMYPRRQGPHLLHQHGFPRSHRRRDAHLDGSRSHGPQGRHAASAPGSRPTRTGTSIRASCAACRARPRSARACGRCPT